MKYLIILLLLITSCGSTNNNCLLLGEWKSVSFTSNLAIDGNKDVLLEDECTEVVIRFKNNGIAERLYKNSRTNCEFQKSILNYIVEKDKILFTVSGMKQKHKFKIENCQLHIYGVLDSGKTETGKKTILINSVFEKE